MVLERVRKTKKMGGNAGDKRIGLFIDGPNILRKEFDIDLDKLREKVKDRGRIAAAKVFMNQFASEKLIEAVASQGFEPVISLGGEQKEEGRSDIDVAMAVSVMDSLQYGLDTIILATRDADFLPLVQTAKERGVEVIIMGMDPGFSTALKNAADEVMDLEQFRS
ncbi:MAG: NYN domain-containing protein [Candidatus Aenigmatarchaeota archaeon]